MQQVNMQTQGIQKEDSNQKYIIVAALSFIIGFGLAWLIVSNKTNEEVVSGTEEESESEIIGEEESETSTDVVTGTANSLKVVDQLAGVKVAVEKVVLNKTSWVVIHEKDQTGQLSRILGAQLFDAGTWSGEVELLRGTMAGVEYVAAIHPDNGDRAFDPKTDVRELDQGGVPVQTAFKSL